MSITIAGASIEERIRDRVESGRYADARDVVSRSLDVLEEQENVQKLRALIAGADADIALHGTIPWTPTFWDELAEEARQLDPNTPLPDHLRP